MANNPVFNENAFRNAQTNASAGQLMTIQGTINKTFFLLLLCVVGAFLTWGSTQALGLITPIAIGALVVGMIISFKPHTAPFLAPIYAVGEGLLLGALSSYFNKQYPGIVMQAISVTMLVFFTMLFLYKTGIIRPTRGFLIGIVSATAGIALFYIISFVLMLFGVNVSYFTSAAPWAIAVNVVVCIIAALNFVLDFHFIDQMTSTYNAPKYMEWYAGFGLLVTLIWLYIEILRLLARSRER